MQEQHIFALKSVHITRSTPFTEEKIAMHARLLVLPALLVIVSLSLPAVAQTKKSASHPANVQTGILVSLDAAAATLTLKPKTGADIPYRLTEKTKILRAKKTVEAVAFKVGDAVVVRFRKS